MQSNETKVCNVEILGPEHADIESRQHDSKPVLVQRELTMPPIACSEVNLPTFHKAMQELIGDAISSVPGVCDGNVQAKIEIMVVPLARITLGTIG